MRGKNKKRPNDNRHRYGVSWINDDPSVAYQDCLSAEQTESHASLPVTDNNTFVMAPSFPGPLAPPSDLTLFNFASPLDSTSQFLIAKCKSSPGLA